MARKYSQQDFDECYELRNHWWKPITVDEDNPAYYVQHLECMRCGGKRRARIDRATGDPVGNNYTMQEGYYHTYEDGENPHQVRKELRLHTIEAELRLQRQPRRKRA